MISFGITLPKWVDMSLNPPINQSINKIVLLVNFCFLTADIHSAVFGYVKHL